MEKADFTRPCFFAVYIERFVQAELTVNLLVDTFIYITKCLLGIRPNSLCRVLIESKKRVLEFFTSKTEGSFTPLWNTQLYAGIKFYSDCNCILK